MKNLVLILYLLKFSILGFSQNLISNPSFEDIDSCYGQPAGIGFDVFSWSGCSNWSCPTTASSDLWCENPVIGNQSPPYIPGVGYQYPKTGENYSGMLIYELTTPEYREYIQNKLTNPLEPNKYYQFSIHVSSNEDSINYSSCLQAYFSNSPISSPDYYTLSFNPQWKNEPNNFIRDTIGWQLVSGIFKANGGEEFVTIGCFDNISNMQMLNKDPLTTSDIYYFIDDLTLIEAPILISFPNVFTPNDDGANELFEPLVVGIADYEVFIYNRWGNLMQILDSNNPSWNGASASDGTYYYMMTSKELEITEQGFFQLVR